MAERRQSNLIKEWLFNGEKGDIPYIKEFRKMNGVESVIGCLIVARLEQIFTQKPNGFIKYIEPGSYQHEFGDSWTEEIGISAGQFRSAFARIGVRYKSQKEMKLATNRFQGKFYASVQVKNLGNATFYFRNHELLGETFINIFGDSDFKVPVWE